MRVLIVNTSERVGGAAIAANRLMEALKKNGVKVKMLVRDKQTDRLTVLPVRNGWMQPLKFVWERLCIFIANNFSRKNHWINQGFLSLSDISHIFQSGKRVVITLHDQWYFTGICHYSGDCQKYTSLCHDCPLMSGSLWGDLAKKVFLQKEKIYGTASLTFVGCSQWMADLAKTSRLTQGHKVVSIPNAINTERFLPMDKAEARRAFRLPQDKQLLLFGCQRITDERKGFTLLVEALQLIKKTHPDVAQATEVVVVGGQAEYVRKQVPFDIIPVNYVSDPQRMVMLYNAVDVYVTPSLQDNLPNTIMEALACGTPCVGFKVGGIPEMIDHKKNGYVATYKDAQDFADGILWTLATDHPTLSRQARNKVMTTYSENAVARKYIDVYEN